MNDHWKKVNFDNLSAEKFNRNVNNVFSKKWKYLIRRGVPMFLMRTIILDIFNRINENNKMEYEAAL